ncbi:E3 ubiquitin-protein ligase Ubr3 [Eumeta japonica]|uniref:E3 ubiquitin-protein ligase n=1 Tax=Eumeta variegata TaxID=151549 RepID=A0A4C1U5M6_EUMVA|nr:E3 ubiquitin-protein ligase Ubr3 [Eumeta japonica]
MFGYYRDRSLVKHSLSRAAVRRAKVLSLQIIKVGHVFSRARRRGRPSSLCPQGGDPAGNSPYLRRPSAFGRKFYKALKNGQLLLIYESPESIIDITEFRSLHLFTAVKVCRGERNVNVKSTQWRCYPCVVSSKDQYMNSDGGERWGLKEYVVFEGDSQEVPPTNFCSNHGNKCPRPGSAPAELMCVAEAVMPRLILRLLQHFRENSYGNQRNSDSYRIAIQECEGYVQMLMDFNNMGDLMRGAMTKALINPQMYRNLVEPPFPETEYGYYMVESKKMYEKAIESFPAPEPPDEYRNLPALALRLQHNTLLDEFIFWTFKYEFPQNIVCFLLNMLPDQDYKEHLTRTFVMHYARIPLVLEAAADPDTLSNRVVHMSVQLFSNETLALRCVQQLQLLHVMVLSLRLMMGKILVQNTLHDPDKNFHYVIDCNQKVMKEHCYWPLVSDFNNVLSHKSVALLFLKSDALVDMWFEFLSMLQGMNVNVREVGRHIEFEPSSYYAAFSCELEAAAYPMWSVLSHLTGPEHAPLARRIIAAALTYLQEWFDAVHFTTPRMERTEVMHASFHFPLHRYLAAFLCQAVRAMGVRAADVLPPPHQLALLAVHPLRVQKVYTDKMRENAEIGCNYKVNKVDHRTVDETVWLHYRRVDGRGGDDLCSLAPNCRLGGGPLCKKFKTSTNLNREQPSLDHPGA